MVNISWIYPKIHIVLYYEIRILGNKADREEDREIPSHIAQTFAATNGFDYFVETSAISSENVETLFQEVATQLTNSEMKRGAER